MKELRPEIYRTQCRTCGDIITFGEWDTYVSCSKCDKVKPYEPLLSPSNETIRLLSERDKCITDYENKQREYIETVKLLTKEKIELTHEFELVKILYSKEKLKIKQHQKLLKDARAKIGKLILEIDDLKKIVQELRNRLPDEIGARILTIGE